MNRIFSMLGRVPVLYWIGHIIVALLIYAGTFAVSGDQLAGAIAGAMFYVGREVRDREKLGYWDWPGLLAPVLSSIIVYFGIERFF